MVSMRSLAASAALGLSFLVLSSGAARASVSANAGWQNAPVPAAAGSAFIGGLAALQNGHVALFDGTSILELDPATGATIGTIYTPPFVFGSFLTADPTGTYLLFGESLNGTVTKVPLNGQPPSLVATLPLNFACTFGPDGAAYVTHAPMAFGSTDIVRVDVGTGTIDLIARLSGASGPVAFGNDGALYYGVNSIAFPAPVGQQSILRFDAGQVAAAIGPGVLFDSDAGLWALGQTAPFGFAVDADGDLFVCDSVDGSVREYDPSGGLKSELGADGTGGATLVALRDGAGPAQMGAFQPAAGGELYVVSSDFFTFNDLNVLRPRRATMDVSPVSPVPVGPLTLALHDGPENGIALLFVAGGAQSPELVAYAGTVPFFIGFAPGALFGSLLLPLDGAGGIAIPAVNHGIGGAGVTLTTQAALIDGSGQPVGTTVASTFTLQ